MKQFIPTTKCQSIRHLYASFMHSMLSGEIQVSSLNDVLDTFLYEEPQTPPETETELIPVGFILQSLNNTNPGLSVESGGLGYGTWSRVAQGKVLVGVDELDTDFEYPNLAVGAKNTVPTGIVSQPTFTGAALSNHTHTFTGDSVSSNAVSAGTPTGTNSAPTFTGNALATHTHTFTGNALANHAHELPVQLVSGTLSRQLASTVFGTGTSRAAQSQQTETANTTSAAVALSQAVSAGTPSGTNAAITAGTPSGTVSAPVFTGSALGIHQHSTTATGSNSSISAGTPTGTVSQPTFTGASHSLIQPSLTVYIWIRTA